MQKFNHIVDIYNNGRLQEVDEWLHDDFLFLKEYGMQNKEEYLEDCKGLFEKDFKMNNPQLVVENDNMVALNHLVVDEDGNKIRVTAVNFIKDEKSWRSSTHRTLMSD
ncbi:hypothetical protein N9X46_06620 [Paracoccaceae bacterium]|nr:hypothetical protein [Paracoccaceae bacterium]MDB3948910.1 hypothetical protein [Paracoccaceae bacterium]